MPRRRPGNCRAVARVVLGVVAGCLAGCQSTREPGNWTELFPHVRINRALGAVEFDAEVRWDFHNPDEPVTLLEQIICTPDSKEHESLAVTLALPSHVHAAMLIAGFEPGVPGHFVLGGDGRVRGMPPTGEPVQVALLVAGQEGRVRRVHPFEWIRFGSPEGPPLMDEARARGWSFVFGGSRIVHRQGRDWYDADMAGPFIGLCTFGSETISLSEALHHESAIQSPLFYVDPSEAARFETLIRVRIERAGSSVTTR